jgi:diguanylate cyclase (GGDEF)-like protein
MDNRKSSSKSVNLNHDKLLNRIVNRIRRSLDLDEILQTTVQEIRSVLNLDRVKIYRFDSDRNGEVIAEAIHRKRLPSLLGLHFPASDIPAEDLQFFLQVRQRVIVDVNNQTKIIQNLDNLDTGESLINQDIRYRPVVPCHAEYLKNMGVYSSLVLPILYQQQLWGLLVCHHHKPRQFSESELTLIQLIVDQVSIAIAQSTLLIYTQKKAENEAIVNEIATLLHSPFDLSIIRQEVLEKIVQALKSDGGRLYITSESTGKVSQLYTTGIQPDYLQLEETDFWQNLMKETGEEFPNNSIFSEFNSENFNLAKTKIICQIYTFNNLYENPKIQSLIPAFEKTPLRSILIIPLRYQQECFGCLTLFRKTIDMETLWAGKQDLDKRNDFPRVSFEIWRELKKAQIQVWNTEEIQLAQALGIHVYLAILQRRIEDIIRYQASHDSLTSLANRLLFEQQLSLSLNHLHQHQEMLAIIFLDLDGFKTINDTLGHSIGDQLLQKVAIRLKNCLRIYDSLARWGGDEFIFLLSHITNIKEVSQIVDKILQSLEKPFNLDRQDYYIKASLGIAIAPYDGEDVETLIKNADAAMYRAKKQGRNQYKFYKPLIGTEAHQRLILENNLYKALEKEEFILYYQPQLDLKTGKIFGVEALIRWQHSELGLISPNLFIPIAEETGLILPIGEWIFRTACTQNKAWHNLGLTNLRISVNLSPLQFQQRHLVTTITQIIEETGIESQFLGVEITESAAMQDIDFAIATLQALQHTGINVSMDDFGTGHSSLWTLKRLPLNTLKIDQSFIRDVMKDPCDASIIKAVITLGRGLNLKIIAEGVETAEQLEFLRSVECDAIQGYFFSVALTASEMVDLYKILNIS